jgi:hypothetical protein
LYGSARQMDHPGRSNQAPQPPRQRFPEFFDGQ